jgi:hypothetical protein
MGKLTERANGSVRWRNLWALMGVCGMVGGLVMAQHVARPHRDAVSQAEFARCIKGFNDRLGRMEAKLDRLIESN